MGKIIYFEDGKEKNSAFRFVTYYRKKSWFKKERIEYTFSNYLANPFFDDAVVTSVSERVKKDYPNAKIYCTEISDFIAKCRTHAFWVICQHDADSNVIGYYSLVIGKNVEWTNDIEDAELTMDPDSANQTADNLRRLCAGKKIGVQRVYLSLENMLLTPIMMITCTSKRGKEETKYFARIEGNRIRLVETSDFARRNTYKDALDAFEYLQSHNKNFKYAVLPVFKDNVHYRNLEAYVKEKNLSRMVILSTKLKWINRSAQK